MDFYTGNVLRLDLTGLHASVEPLNAEWARLFVGGKGLLLRYLFEELAPGADALAPENPLILATGPFAGTLAATCSRLAVGCKSPATGTLLDSYVGGSFAPELKFAGYDLVVITGRAPEPVLVRITDDEVEFVPAEGRYWGLETAPLEALVGKEMGPGAKVLSTGPAGENLVPFACLSTDQFHKAGRGGAGAVMGSKNLKAVAVRGTGAVTVGDAEAFTRDVLRLQGERVLTADNAWTYEEGTPFLVEAVNGAGALPTRNWRTGTFDGAGTIGSAALLRIRTKIRACTQCPLACRQVHDFGDYTCCNSVENMRGAGFTAAVSRLETAAAMYSSRAKWATISSTPWPRAQMLCTPRPRPPRAASSVFPAHRGREIQTRWSGTSTQQHQLSVPGRVHCGCRWVAVRHARRLGGDGRSVISLQMGGSAYGIRTRVTAVRGRPEGLPDRDQRSVTGRSKSQELWSFAASVPDADTNASQRRQSRTAHLGCRMIAESALLHRCHRSCASGDSFKASRRARRSGRKSFTSRLKRPPWLRSRRCVISCTRTYSR